MARAKKPIEEAGSEWMNTYADLVTLLLCFFIMLFSMSTVEVEKFEAMVKSFRKMGIEEISEDPNAQVNPDDIVVDPNDYPLSDFDGMKEYIEEVMEENGISTEDVQIMESKGVLYIRFMNNMLFSPNSAQLKYEAQKVLAYIGEAFVALDDQIQLIKVSGHTAKVDGVKTGVSDRLLSTDRANAVLMYFEDKVKVDPVKLIANGYGMNYPIAPNDTEAGRSKNRRVELLVLAKSDDAATMEQIANLLGGAFDLKLYDNYQ